MFHCLRLACCIQELGRFPDLGSYTAPAPSSRDSDAGSGRPEGRHSSSSKPRSTSHSPTETPAARRPPLAPSTSALKQSSGKEDSSAAPAADAPEPRPVTTSATTHNGALDARGASPQADAEQGAQRNAHHLEESRESNLADISDSCSEDVPAASQAQPAGDMVRGGEVGPDDSTASPGAAGQHHPIAFNASTWLELTILPLSHTTSANVQLRVWFRYRVQSL
jgi:hypothetical protein